MKKFWYTGNKLVVLFLFFISLTTFHGCGGGGGGSSSTGTATISTVPISVTASDGSVLTTPEGGHEGASSVTLSIASSDSTMAPAGETLVSEILNITTTNDAAFFGNGHYTLSIPVDVGNISDTDKLQLNIKLRNDIVIPAHGIFDSSSGTFVVHLSGIVNGWSLAVTENPAIQKFSYTPPSSKSWLTDLNWETYAWEVINHSDMTRTEIEDTIMPTLLKASQTLAEAGFRAPRIYIDPRLTTPARVVHIIQGTGRDSSGSHFSSGPLEYIDGVLTYSDEDMTFSTEFLTDDEYTALGKMYINHEQYAALNTSYGISLGNIVIHELFHAVQYGYDIRKSGAIKTIPRGSRTARVFEGSLKAYLEGTATALGQTFQLSGDTSITGPSIAVRSLRSDKQARLYQAVDSPEYAFYYTKQDFFAYVAKRYNSNSWAYTEQLFEYMSIETANQFGKTVPQYLALYRSAMDKCFKDLFNKGLTEVYTTYARDRAYEHSEYSILRPTTNIAANGFIPNSFYWPLFRWNNSDDKGVKRLDTAGITFEKIPPLSTISFWAELPAPTPNSDGFALSLNLTGGSVTSGITPGIKIKAYIEGSDEIMIDNGSFEITDISKPVVIPLNSSPSFVTIIVSNSYMENTDVKLVVKPAPYIESISPSNPLPGDNITIYGTGFGDSQQSNTLTIAGTTANTITGWSDRQIVLTLPDSVNSGNITVTVNGNDSNEALLVIGTPSPNWEMVLNIDLNGDDSNLWSNNNAMPMYWQLLEIYNTTIPISVADNGILTFRHSWTENTSDGPVSHHVEGTGTFDGRDLSVTGNWSSSVSDTDASDGATYTQSDSGSFTGTGRYNPTFETYFPNGFTATYQSSATRILYDNNGDVESDERPSFSGTIAYYELAEIDEFRSTSK